MTECALKVDIAGLTFGLKANTRLPLDMLRQAYHYYLSDKPAQIPIRIYYRQKSLPLTPNRLFSRPYHIDSNGRIYRVYTKRDYIGIGDLLRLLTAFILVKKGGFLLHSCGVVINAGAYLFAGPSGVGKTTLARLINNGYTLLSDETTAVIKEGGNYYGCATPFFGDFGKTTLNVKAPLKGIFFLKKASRFGHRRINSLYAASRLMQNIFILGNYWRKNGAMAMLMDIASAIARKIPVYELEFLANKRVWKYIEEKISPGVK